MLNEKIISVFKSWLDDNGIPYDDADEDMWINEIEKLEHHTTLKKGE